MSTYNIHAGHNPAGMIACGAQGLLSESVENRLIAGEMIRLLRAAGHTVYDCTVDNGTSQNDVLAKIVTKCNAHTVDFDFSIHLNSGRNDSAGDGSVGGFEVWVSGTTKGKGELAESIRAGMKEIGFTDRGTKTTSGLYVLNKTTAPALLLEICFVDDADDYNLYKNVGYKAIAQAIVNAITGQAVTGAVVSEKTETFAASTVTGNSTSDSDSSAEKLTVDGKWGPATTKRLQQIFGTTVDSKISNQPESLKKNNPGLYSSTWEFVSNASKTNGSQLIKAIQKKVGTTQDGLMGTKTITAMQKWLGTTQDGKVSNPSQMVKALQKWANQQ